MAALGLVLRVAAARGGLWLDEAWSAVLADTVGTPLGIFTGINHDNNHHLNSLWLLIVGLDAPPILARALSIASGTAAIAVAGLIGARRGCGVGAITALLFAVSPVLVTLGSEARGYAPMTLMALIAIWYVDRFLGGDETADRPVTLAVCAFVGALFQLTMIFAVCAIAGWVLLALWRRIGFAQAVAASVRLLGPAFVALGLALAIAFAPSAIGGVEFRFGAREAFALPLFLRGLIDLLGCSIGYTATGLWLPAAAMILVIVARRVGTPRLAFYWLAIVAFPITTAALHMINAGVWRYYLLAGLALLLLLAEAIAVLIRAGGWKLAAGATALAAISAASLAADLDLIANRRGDPAPAIAAMAARAPEGAKVLIVGETGLALLKVAAAEAGYPLTIQSGCQARFVFADRPAHEPDGPAALRYCDILYRPIAGARARGLSGQNWTLYEKVA